MPRKPKTVECKIAWSSWHEPAEWKKHPEYITDDIRVINRIFGVRYVSELEHRPAYSLTHRPTGFSAGWFRCHIDARKAALRLTKEWGEKAWRFTDFDEAKKLGPRAKIIIRECGGV